MHTALTWLLGAAAVYVSIVVALILFVFGVTLWIAFTKR